MKLSEYAKKAGVRYETAWRWFRDGQIKGHKLDTGTIIITEDYGQEAAARPQKVAVYARVSANENRPNLVSQAERLVQYCTANGWQVERVITEVGSGVNDTRPKLLKLLADETITFIVVEHKDRLTRFGFNYIETLMAVQGRKIEVVNKSDNAIDDILADLTSIVYSFCARLYGQRRAKRKTEKIVNELNAKGEADETEDAPEAPQEPQVVKAEHANGTSPQQPVQRPTGRGKGKGKANATGGTTHSEQERLPF